MVAVALASVCALAWGCSDFVGGLRSRRLPVLSVTLLMLVGGAIASFLAVAVFGVPWPGSAVVLPSVLAGVFSLVAVSCVYRSLSIGPMGIVAPISGAYPVVPVVAGLLQGERPSAPQVAGMALVVVSVMLVSYARPSSGGPRVSRQAIGTALVAALASGLTLTFVSTAAARDPYWGMALMRTVASAGVVLVLLARRRPLGLLPVDAPVLLGIGVLDTFATGLFGYAASLSDLALVAVISSMFPLVTVLVARFTLHERLAWYQLLAVGSALGGVAMIAAA